MTGRNNKPKNDGSASNPSRLDQFGDTMASNNFEEFQNAVDQAEQACETADEENR